MQDTEMVNAANSGISQGQSQHLRDEELDEKYPNRPRNHSPTLPFHDLFLTLFNPLNDNKKKPTGPVVARKKVGPHGGPSHNPHEIRQNIIERFISRWRNEVGNDIYPAFRLIIPEKDRERAMYGLKEKTIGKLLIKVMKINKDSEDGFNLLNWKQPGQTVVSRMAGDFAGRCYEVISKRPMRTSVGDMTIGEVNDLLDRLSAASREDQQMPIFTEFYTRMDAHEMMWLIRIILRQMKVGATEKTFFNIWHPDAESLFNVSSNLRRVCWELHDPDVRLEGEDRGISLMQCFQPQLAQFQMHSFDKMIQRMRPTEEDPVFWIEEKLDGERMQLHMISDDNVPGGKRFKFWSRKAKDYTYLYGDGFNDGNSALTRHLKGAFDEGVDSVVLDGEMITWDLEQDAMVPFGTLKTAALEQQKNEFSKGMRPLYKVFDCLLLNGHAITNYTLRDRRRALRQAVKDIPRRLEVHTYKEARSAKEIEPLLRQVVAESSEGLVLKNPRSSYRLNDRNDDWMKVKPEYMTEFGENLDCVIIGGYYGSGRRGGRMSSFMCGLRVDENQIRQGADPMKCYSFFKVGGGFTSADYAAIRHKTDGKWKKWDPKNPPTQYIELAGGALQYERPDEWILPSDSLVVEVKAASIGVTDSFKMGLTLRFPRFKKVRSDRDWQNALSVSDFITLKNNVENEGKEKRFKVDDNRKKRQRVGRKKPLTIAGSEAAEYAPHDIKTVKIFEGLSLYIMTGCQKPNKKSKAELEQLAKSYGAGIVQNDSRLETFCIGDQKTVHVAATMTRDKKDIIRPSWLLDNIAQNETDGERPTLLLPLEPQHILFTKSDSEGRIEDAVDEYKDSYARDVTIDELKEIFTAMPAKYQHSFDAAAFRKKLIEHEHGLGESPGWMFSGLLVYANTEVSNITDNQTHFFSKNPAFRLNQACHTVRFAGGTITNDLKKGVTHVLVDKNSERGRIKSLREKIAQFKRLPRLVTVDWIEESWRSKTLLDEERFTPG
ncbi:DNA ligase (ATP) [Lecanora helva]